MTSQREFVSINRYRLEIYKHDNFKKCRRKYGNLCCSFWSYWDLTVKDFIILFVYLCIVGFNLLCNRRYSLIRPKCVINASISVFKRKIYKPFYGMCTKVEKITYNKYLFKTSRCCISLKLHRFIRSSWVEIHKSHMYHSIVLKDTQKDRTS